MLQRADMHEVWQSGGSFLVRHDTTCDRGRNVSTSAGLKNLKVCAGYGHPEQADRVGSVRAVLMQPGTGVVSVEELPEPARRPDLVVIRNGYSLLSAGTERAAVENASRSLTAKLRDRPDKVAKLISKVREAGPTAALRTVRDQLDPPAIVLGYSCAGYVIDPGGTGYFVPNDLVAAAGAGYAVHADVIAVPHNLCVKVPHGVSAHEAAFATVGAIALRGIHQAGTEPGSRVAVIGLGLIGQLAVRLLKAYGYDVVGIDVDEPMVDRARTAGIRALVRSSRTLVSDVRRSWNDGLADAVLITAATASTDPIELAGQLARDRATVVVLGDVAVRPSRATYYHKELEIKYSRSYGPGRYDPLYEEGGLPYPEGFVPWDERRNLSEVLRLVSIGALDIGTLAPEVLPVQDAAAAYRRLTNPEDRQVAILLSYAPGNPVAADTAAETERLSHEGLRKATVRLGVLGAGSFASNVLLPILTKDKRAELAWLASGRAINAFNESKRWKFNRTVSSLEEGIALGETDGVLVLTRHDSHATSTALLLRLGITAFCEKPLALSEEQLEDVSKSWLEGGAHAMVGFNRRFAPLLQELKVAIKDRGPLQLSYRVFAGQLDPHHWYFDREQGGRVHGEVCHFVDTLCWLVGSPAVAVTARAVGALHDPVTAQSVTALLEFTDGSVASLTYCGNSPSGPPKELLEVSADNFVGRLHDFVLLETWNDGTKHETRSKVQDKGHRAEMSAFVQLVAGEDCPEADFALSLASTLVTCRLADSLVTDERRDTRPVANAMLKAIGALWQS